MISIVIVNWNYGHGVRLLVKTIIDQFANYEWRPQIIIVDNNSSDGSVEILRTLSDDVTIIASSVNHGFAGGCNLGCGEAIYPLILFLNPDTIVDRKTIVECVEFMNHPKNSRVGVLGIQLVNEGGLVTRSSARFPRASMFLLQNLGVTRFLPALGHTMSEWPHDQTREVDQVIGAFFLTRREVYDRLGGFDERFFVYFEEVDYAYRARKIGYSSVFFAGAQAFHEGEGTTAKIKGRRLFYLLRSRILYGKKHYNALENLLNILNTLIVEPASRTGYLLVSGRKSELPALREGFGLLYKDLPNILSQKMRP